MDAENLSIDGMRRVLDEAVGMLTIPAEFHADIRIARDKIMQVSLNLPRDIEDGIYCCDCNFATPCSRPIPTDKYFCNCLHGLNDVVNPHDFCSHGQRKEACKPCH